MKPVPTIGAYLMRLLRTYGVDTVFGIPGVHTLELYRGIASENIRHVLVRHEQGAGFMADGYARVTGRPGVCTLITGPGLTNALTAIAQAYSDSIPMLVISTVNATADLGRGLGRLHEMTDQAAMIAPAVAFTRTARSAEDLAAHVAEAFNLFAAARPRPVHIQVPIDVMGQPATHARIPDRPAVVQPPRAGCEAVMKAARLLASAQRPVIIVGGGSVDAFDEVRTVVERLDAAVVTTVAGKGVVPDSHPLCLGATLATSATRAELADADVVLAVGTELAETDHWTDRLNIQGSLIRLDRDVRKLNDCYPCDLPLLGDARLTLLDLLAALETFPPLPGTETRTRAVGAESNGGDTYGLVLDAIRAALPEDGIVATDMTQLAYAANGRLGFMRPRSYLHPSGFGTLGYGLPAAIGAKIAAPNRPVVAIVGDGGFLFTISELATAVEERLSLPVILWDNNGLGQIRDDMIRRQMPQIGVSPLNPDYLTLARGFGIPADDIHGIEHLSRSLSTALSVDGPTLIRVSTENI